MRLLFLYRLWIIFVCTILPSAAKTQQVQISLNKNKILIGQQIELGFKVVLPKGTKAAFSFPDSIPHFEILDKKDIQAVQGENALEQVIVLTSFDSGQFYFPSIPVILSDGSGKKNISSDSILISVGYAADNPLTPLRDIKPVRYLEINDYFWYYVLGLLILLFLILFLLYDYFAKRNKKPVETYKHSAYDEAMQSIATLESTSFHRPEEIRKFHTSLSEIFKRYYGRKIHAELYNKTTTDILILVQQYHAGDTSDTASVLRANDAVSFAKYFPKETDSRNYLSALRTLIRHIENPKEKVEL